MVGLFKLKIYPGCEVEPYGSCGKNRHLIIGVDEAGRGPLAGPVLACACYIEEHVDGVADSKKLTPAKRLDLASEIICKGQVCIGIENCRSIDVSDILSATMSAMRTAANALSRRLGGNGLVIIDGNRVPEGLVWQGKAIVGADNSQYCVSCASIVAKVVRDHLMDGFDTTFPGYGFSKNKGYGTADHLDAISRLGPCQIHRRSFGPCK